MRFLLARAFLACVLPLTTPAQEIEALWRCEPAEVAVGEPFALVLELLHPERTSGRALASGVLALEASWVVLDEPALASEAVGQGRVRTRRTWRLASLEPGERALGEALASFALPQEVQRIALGEARVRVSGVLAEGEDTPRPLREFPPGFADLPPSARGPGALAWAAGVLAVAALGWALLRMRRRARAPAGPSPLERLRELERAATGGGERCYELTRLLRESGDALRKRPGAGLTDEEWLAEVRAAHELPRGVVDELVAVFERTARVKYAGETPTPWALEETFARARAALEGLTASGGRA